MIAFGEMHVRVENVVKESRVKGVGYYTLASDLVVLCDYDA
jgi:hypothetical protein